MIFKSLENSIKDVDTAKGIVKFAFAHFGSKDSDGDIIVKGAYQKTISELGPTGKDRIYHYKNHDSNQAVGKPIEIYETGEHAIMISQLSKNSFGRDALIEYQEGIIKEHSQGFYIPKGKQEEKDGANYIKEVIMAEASTLTKWAANPNTPVFDLKNKKSEELTELLAELTSRVKIGKFSDEYLSAIEHKIKQLQAAIHSLKPDDSTSKEPDGLDLINYFKSNLSI